MTRDKVIRVRVTEQERELIETAAKSLGLTMSEFLRLMLLQHQDKLKMKF